MKYSKTLSSKRIAFLREQGYTCSDNQIQELAFGNRFTFFLHLILITPAVIMANIPFLSVMGLIVLSNIFLPNHPFDYIYNYMIRIWTKGPKLPSRSPQFKFASIVAFTIITTTIYFIAADMMTAAYIMGAQLIIGASIVSFFDFCFLARIYNFILAKINSSMSFHI